MPDFKQFKLPDTGEGLTEAEILKWFVQPGDQVALNQVLVEIETAKAAVELPSPFDGVVKELHVTEGATVDVGAPIITIDVDPTGTPEALRDDMVPEIPAGAGDELAEGNSVLVGYGPRTGATKRRPRKAPTGPVAEPVQAVEPEPVIAEPEPARSVAVLAKPPVRKLAKDLGVDLSALNGTGPNGTITRDDVTRAAEPDTAPEPVAAAQPEEAPAWGPEREQRIPIKGVRKHTAAAMVASAFTAPHVTTFLTVDVTATMELRQRVAARPEFAELKVTPLLFVAKALLLALRRHPMINSAWDEERQEIVIKEYVNLGIAAATPRGLIVPNVKDAGRLSLRDLAGALAELTETARAGKTPPADMSGGTITITNVGVFGVDTGTPILNPGEAAILAVGAVREMPWVVDGQIVPRQVAQLSLSFDHRIIDGQLGSRFLADVGAILHDPELAVLWS